MERIQVVHLHIVHLTKFFSKADVSVLDYFILNRLLLACSNLFVAVGR